MERKEYWSTVKSIAQELSISVQEAREVVRGIYNGGNAP